MAFDEAGMEAGASGGGDAIHPVLVGTGGGLAGRRFPVHEDGLRIGRADECEVVLDDAGVSREHARVLLHNEAVWVQDLGSRNGCFINGRRLTRHKQLGPGDELRIGDHTFTLELADPFGDQESVSIFGAPPPSELAGEPTRELPVAAQGNGKTVVIGVGIALVAVLGVLAWLLVG